MKKLTLLICLFSALAFTGCRNNQVGDEALIIGKWQVMKSDVYSKDKDGKETKDTPLCFWEFTETKAIFRSSSTGNLDTPYELELEYKLTRNENNTLFFLFNGQVYTIHKLNQNEMEWEHLDFWGSGSSYYDYLKKVK